MTTGSPTRVDRGSCPIEPPREGERGRPRAHQEIALALWDAYVNDLGWIRHPNPDIHPGSLLASLRRDPYYTTHKVMSKRGPDGYLYLRLGGRK